MSTLGKGFVDALKEGVTKSGEKDTKAFAKALDGMQRNVSGVANLFRGSELTNSLVVRDQLSSTVFSSTVGWQIKGDGTATFRNVTVSGGSLLITNTTDRIHLQSDGDAFFGSNIAAPATTSFSVFSNAQTYNSESMGAGDVLFGDNSANKANLLWDASAGKILFRGGATTQGYIDTAGRAVFGGGGVYLGSTGLGIQESTSSSSGIVAWFADMANYGTLNYLGAIYTQIVGTPPNEYGLVVIGPQKITASNEYGGVWIASDTNTYPRAEVYVEADSSSSETRIISTTSSGVKNDVWFKDTISIFNEDGDDVDLRVEGDTATNLLVADAGLDAVQIGTTTAGAIADFRAATIVLNEASADMDIRMEGATATSLLVLDGGLDAVQIGTTTAGAILDARATGVIINDGGLATVDFTVEGDTETQLLFVDASADKVYYKGTEIGTGAGGADLLEIQVFS